MTIVKTQLKHDYVCLRYPCWKAFNNISVSEVRTIEQIRSQETVKKRRFHRLR